jgi:hypothetical protein
MSTPTWNGLSIFGAAVVMRTESNPASVQVNDYAQVVGREVVNLGPRGGRTLVVGILEAPNEATMAATMAAMRNRAANFESGVLFTTMGETFAYSQFATFQPSERVLRDRDGTFVLPYSATIEHLI